MPELPEVETTRSGLEPYVLGQRIESLQLNRRDLRWPVSSELPAAADTKKIVSLMRRGKYLIFELEEGYILSHLGMSGSIRVCLSSEPRKKHDHWQLKLVGQDRELRFNDPRRFGALFWKSANWQQHDLIRNLGPEPLLDEFDGSYLHRRARGRTLPIKSLIMDSKVVVGVGNIYAAESLFHAGIHPMLASGKLSKPRADRLVTEIKTVLASAIAKGGTTLRDYVNGSGKPGYFQQELWVYGRSDQPCKVCSAPLKEIRLGQRATCFCRQCQKR